MLFGASLELAAAVTGRLVLLLLLLAGLFWLTWCCACSTGAATTHASRR
jgi:hypothetical protein